jgi:HAD superfamily hydrolase (TIGR01509 family)
VTPDEAAELLGRKHLLLFDFDGTIVDTSPIHARAFNEAFATEGIAVDYARIAGLVTDAAVDLVAAEAGLALPPERRDELIREKRARARSYIRDEIRLLDGSDEFVGRARNRWAVALCTSASRETVDVALGAVGLEGVFDPVISGSDVHRGKPDPEVFELALAHHRAQPADALVFEDADSGLAAARAAGIDAIHVIERAPCGRGQADWPTLCAALDRLGV